MLTSNALPSTQLVMLIVAAVAAAVVTVTDGKPTISCGPNEYRSRVSVSSIDASRAVSGDVGAASSVAPASSTSGGGSAGGGGVVICLPCTVCPPNQVIRRPCSKLSDTVCGPLYIYDFDFFNEQVGSGASGVSPPPPKRKLEGSFMVQSNSDGSQRVVPWRSSDRLDLDLDIEVLGHSTNSMAGSPTKDPGRLTVCFVDEWSAMCYGVLGGMTIIVLVVVVVAVLIWYRLWIVNRKPRFIQRHGLGVARQSRPLLVIGQSNGSNAHMSHDQPESATVFVVDRRVRHLETQLFRQRQQLNFRLTRLLTGGGGGGGGFTRPLDGNEYVDYRKWIMSVRSRSSSASEQLLNPTGHNDAIGVAPVPTVSSAAAMMDEAGRSPSGSLSSVSASAMLAPADSHYYQSVV